MKIIVDSSDFGNLEGQDIPLVDFLIALDDARDHFEKKGIKAEDITVECFGTELLGPRESTPVEHSVDYLKAELKALQRKALLLEFHLNLS